MTNHTIATPITTWAALRSTDREVLNRSEVASLLAVDPRTVDNAIEDGTLPSVRLGRRVLIPRRPFLEVFGCAGRAVETRSSDPLASSKVDSS
ncbi:excisionase family DNA-binding protein [uncultured Nocardioides sp.]|uniref:excisionase family DNA-binding protein n=1 Tax=uncultured Nocardioides sp. TaxID=198441 RepID=UPI002600A16F|nr:helix-turn-helix domain-containing protein [uncultured Nocardioides sp.]